MVTNKNILLFFAIILLIPFISSVTSDNQNSLGYFTAGEDISLIQICGNSQNPCDNCNLTSVRYPNSSSIIEDVGMTKRFTEFNYTLLSNYTSVTGEYLVNGFCQQGSSLEIFAYSLDVTTNGKEPPAGGVIVLFTILFIGIIGILLSLLMYNIFHIIQWDLDGKDLIFNVSSYFVLFAVYILGKEYLGNLFINDFLVWLIGIASLTNVILPIIGFMMSYVKGGLDGNDK